jgi:hypothetical protein
MNIRFAETLLNILIENAVRIIEANFGVDRAEPTFFQIVDLVREHPPLKDVLLARIASALRERDAGTLKPDQPPRELIELLVHEFRWPEVRELGERRLNDIFRGDRRLAIGDIYYKLIEAERADWPDREFYARYRAQPAAD